MKKLLIALALATATTTASANFDFFNNDNDGEWKMGPYGPYWDEGNDWPEWTPMYWMQEFMDAWDDNDNNYYGGAMMPYGAYAQQPMMPYGAYPQPAMPAPAMPMAPMPAPAAPAPAPAPAAK